MLRVGSAEEKERRTEGPRGRVHSSWSQQKQLELQDGHGRGWGCSLWNGYLDQCWHQCGREGTTPLSQASQLCVSGPQAPGDSLPSLSSPSQPGGPDPVTSSVDWEGPTVHCRGKLPVSFSPPSPRTPVKHAGRAGIPRNWIPPPEPPSNMGVAGIPRARISKLQPHPCGFTPSGNTLGGPSV